MSKLGFITKWSKEISWTWLQNLAKKFPKFGSSKIPGGPAVFSQPANSPAAMSALQWIKKNPVAFAFHLLTIGVLADDIGEFFTNDEKRSIMEELNGGGHNHLFTAEELGLIDANMGDGDPGTYLGRATNELMSNAELIQQSIKRTEALANYLGISPSAVGLVVKLIISYEAEDEQIYQMFKSRR